MVPFIWTGKTSRWPYHRNILLESKRLHYIPVTDEKGAVDEGTRYGSATFQQETVSEKLRSIGLPVTTNLSVVCVEMFPLNNLWRLPTDATPGILQTSGENASAANAAVNEGPNPLIEGLGRYRIYRTSPLVAVGDICCDDC